MSFIVLFITLTSLLGCGNSGSLSDSIGEGCFTDDECPGTLFCSSTSPTDVCAAECSSDTECHETYGSQFDCVNGNSRCARRCNSDADCPDSDCVGFTSGDSYCSN